MPGNKPSPKPTPVKPTPVDKKKLSLEKDTLKRLGKTSPVIKGKIEQHKSALARSKKGGKK
jgi:hypothetical protein